MKLLDPDSKVLDLKEARKRKRERVIIILLTTLFVLLTAAEIKLTELSSTLPFVNSIFFFGLLNINLILLVAIIWLVFRNVGKIFLERRSRVLGSRLKTKLVLAFVGLSVIPTVVLFIISSAYINSSFDKWFSLKVQNTLQGSLEITRTYYKNASADALHFAQHLANQMGGRLKEPPIETPRWVKGYLLKQRELLAINSIEYYSDPFDERVIVKDNPSYYPRLSLELLEKAFAGEKVSVIQHVGSGDLIRCLVPIYARGINKITGKKSLVGVIAVSTYIPVSLVNKVDEIASVFDDYQDTNPLKYPVKTTYFVILIMITLVIIFVAIWIGLFLAKQLTEPVERLVHGAQEVGSGNLEVFLEPSGQDELSVLMDSFNNMIKDLKENREELTKTSTDLEKRTIQLEAVLANIGAGVIVVDKAGDVTTFNRAAAQLLKINPKDALGKKYEELFTAADTRPVEEIIKREFQSITDKTPTLPGVIQWTTQHEEKPYSLTAIATTLQEGDTTWGVVVVIDDMTHIIKAQREVAWREVARRIAHEIKNPLTPIKLSAQRLQRRLSQLTGRDGELLQECTSTIVKHTDELKNMVNEFSSFARFPETQPAPDNLNEVVKEVYTLFSQAHQKIQFMVKTESRIPIFEFDRDQIKRVIMNLLDNGVAALEASDRHDKKMNIETHFNEQLQMAVITVQDNGPGMSEEIKSQVFEPYFSTKKQGTGLGLAIAKRIVNDHDGFIRVQSSEDGGTQFLIELPTAPKTKVERFPGQTKDTDNEQINPSH